MELDKSRGRERSSDGKLLHGTFLYSLVWDIDLWQYLIIMCNIICNVTQPVKITETLAYRAFQENFSPTLYKWNEAECWQAPLRTSRVQTRKKHNMINYCQLGWHLKNHRAQPESFHNLHKLLTSIRQHVPWKNSESNTKCWNTGPFDQYKRYIKKLKVL